MQIINVYILQALPIKIHILRTILTHHEKTTSQGVRPMQANRHFIFKYFQAKRK